MSALLLVMLGCDGVPPSGTSTPVDRPDEPEPDPFAPAVRSDLRMKRWRQISLDLQGALALTPDDVCRETDLYDCFDLHAVPMGGLSQANGIYRASEGVGVTTGLAIERVSLQACWRAVERDRQDPQVFTLDLESDDAEIVERRAQVVTLYQRFLARDPLDDERDVLVDLHASIVADGGTNADWAVLSCFVVATSTEALLY